MIHASALNAPQSFDLTDLAANADRARRFRVLQSNFVRGIGAALVVVGTYFYVDPPAGSIPSYSTGPLIFIVIGVVIAGYGSWTVASLGPSARRLVLSNDSLSFEQIPRRRPVRLEWRQVNFKLEIYDFREIRKADPKSRSRGYEIILQPPRGPETAVPREALEAILRDAEAHRLRMTQKSVAIGAKAPMLVTTIRPNGQA